MLCLWLGSRCVWYLIPPFAWVWSLPTSNICASSPLDHTSVHTPKKTSNILFCFCYQAELPGGKAPIGWQTGKSYPNFDLPQGPTSKNILAVKSTLRVLVHYLCLSVMPIPLSQERAWYLLVLSHLSLHSFTHCKRLTHGCVCTLYPLNWSTSTRISTSHHRREKLCENIPNTKHPQFDSLA